VLKFGKCSEVLENGSASQKKSSRGLVPTCLYQDPSRALSCVRLHLGLWAPLKGLVVHMY
jgi:hypothetical protein